jgi:hypothetical protein
MITDEQLKELRAQTPQWARPTRMASIPQQQLITRMIEERDIPEEWLRNIKRIVEENKLTVPKASQIITDLKKMPYKRTVKGASASTGFGEVPAGYYALPVVKQEPGGNDLVFYRVKKHKDDPNRGWVHRVLGPDEGEVPSAQVLPILNRIKKYGLGKSATLYGKTIGKCSQCNRRLTKRLSRELSMGAICGGRVYTDDWDERVEAAVHAIIERGEDPNESV